jgi:hypothetical protein
MITKSKGYVIVSNNHPSGSEDRIFTHTFRELKRDAILHFIYNSGEDWKFWKTKWNFNCVKAEITISTEL